MPSVASLAASAAGKSSTSFGSMLGYGSAAGAADGLVGQLFAGLNAARQWKYRQKEMELQQRYQLEQMAKEYEYQRAVFDYTNEYNDPSAVMARFRAAGINPSAVMGSSGASLSATMPAGSPPSGGSVGGGPSYSSGGVGSSVSASGVQMALAKSQENLNNANAENARSSANLSDSRVLSEAVYRDLLGEKINTERWNAYQSELQAGILKIDLEKHPELVASEIKRNVAQADNFIAQSNLADEDAKLVRQQTATEIMRQSLLTAQTSHVRSLARLVDLQAQGLDKELQAALQTRKMPEIVVEDNGSISFARNADGSIKYNDVDGFQAARLSQELAYIDSVFVSMRDFVQADWANADKINETLQNYIKVLAEAGNTLISGFLTFGKGGKLAQGKRSIQTADYVDYELESRAEYEQTRSRAYRRAMRE